ncbi:MAG TPA: dienelactone hydrolase family protein [Candidatus Competibacteraceae bacterium]|nr:dienelactone hydrolase family protein [Candidatus Competibacteraceae bacterium]
MKLAHWLSGSLLSLSIATGASAEMITRDISYTLDGTEFKGTLVYDDASPAKRPGLLMVPNWLGINPANLEQAKLVAGTKYVVFVADMYGVGVRPQNSEQAMAAVKPLRENRALMRARINKALAVLKAQADSAPLDTARLGAFGFCFGGGVALELARSGTPVGGVVSFHGNLDTPDPADARNIKSKILVLHGADDPSVPPAQVQAFEAEMKSVPGLDWQLVSFGGAVHSFTDPDANVPGRNQYHPVVARRAYRMMDEFFTEIFGS